MRRLMRLTLVMGVCSAMLVGAGCGSSDDEDSGSSGSTTTAAASEDKSPVTIAATLGLTGGLAYYDKALLNGMELAIEQINADGGAAGHPIELIKNDNGTDLDQLVPKAQELIAKKPTLLVTSNSDTTGIPAARAAQAAGQLVMSNVGPTTYGQDIGDLVFNSSYGDPTVGAAMSEFAQKKGWDKVVLVADEALGYTKDVCALFKSSFTAVNASGVVSEITYNSTTDTSFPSQVSAIRDASDAQAVMLCGIVVGAPTLIKQMRSAGVDLPILGVDALDGVDWTKPVPNMGEFYAVSIGSNDPDGGSLYDSNPNPDQKAFIDAYVEKYDRASLIQSAVGGYTIVQIFAAAIEKAEGKTDSESLASALESFESVPSIMGPTTYTADCHVAIGRPLAITQVTDHVGEYLETITPKAESIPEAPC